jgi:hypothetical protein
MENIYAVNRWDYLEKPTCFDLYSILHLLVGIFITYVLLIYYQFNEVYYIRILCIGFMLHTLYEIKDYIRAYIIPPSHNLSRNDWANNSLLNSIGDTIAFIIGFFIIMASFPLFQKYNRTITYFYIPTFIIIIIGIYLYFLYFMDIKWEAEAGRQ